MLDRLPEEILVHILTIIISEQQQQPLEDVVKDLSCVCRSWSQMLDSTPQRDRFWMLLATSQGFSIGHRRSRNTAKKMFFRRYREVQQAKKHDMDKKIHKLARRLEKNDCVALIRKSISTVTPSSSPTTTISSSTSIVHRAVPSMDHRTLLHLACWWGRIKTVKMLLNDCQASLFVQDDLNATPLLMAAWAGHSTVVQVLLTHLKGRQCCGPEEDLPQTKLLLQDYIHQKGIPPLTSSCGGRGPKTALVWAYRKKFPVVVKLLMQAADIHDMDNYLKLQNENVE
jgi:hypothetical protein